MKKMNLALSMMALTGMGIGAYVLMNKSTKQKADKLINNLLDKANNMTSNMSN